MRNQLTCSKLWKLCKENSSKSQLKEQGIPQLIDTIMWQHLCVCVCLCFLLGYLHVPLVRRSATAATATATIAAGRQIVPGKGEWGNGERGTVVDPQVLTLAPKCF